ncbi:MAG: Holliday junction branch migration protein RuvA [Gammaproteobacteria bacterium]|nr:MAG: Holliday junction branch migration protein RuvA [Gammaproteobacteria bacterium]
MIGLLRGRVLQKQPPYLLLDVNGVGYELEAPMSTFYHLPADEQPVTLYTHLAIRDDAHVLYGFACEADRALFRALLKVSGVGGKMALAILSGMSADEFALTVQAGDAAALTRLPGVGKKTAERLIVEMRDRLEKLETGPVVAVAGAAGSGSAGTSAADDAVSALLALGYKPAEAQRMVKSVPTEGLSTEEIIRAALQGG